MAIRTDLAYEAVSSISPDGQLPPGINKSQRSVCGMTVTEITVDGHAAELASGKPSGRYVTVHTPPMSSAVCGTEEQVEALADIICDMLPDLTGQTVLVVGLGNSDITPDALGPKTVGRILATRHLTDEPGIASELMQLSPVAALATGVLGQTGIEAAEIVKAVCKNIRPAAVCVIDALACAEPSRLGVTVQLSDTGISPGSGVKNTRKELSRTTVGVPVLAIGVPTVIDLHTAAENLTGRQADDSLPNMMVTPRDVDTLISGGARFIASALNKAFQPSLSVGELLTLTS